MADERERNDAAPDDVVQQIVRASYARFCAEQSVRPNAANAKRFALEATASGARAFHGLDSAALEHFLVRTFGGPSDGQ